MMTKARPMAISRSRVQTRISLRSECPTDDESGAPPEVNGGAEDSGTVEVGGCRSSVLCILPLPRIYNMGVARDARCCFAGRRFRQRSVACGVVGRIVALPLDADGGLTVACFCNAGDALKRAPT